MQSTDKPTPPLVSLVIPVYNSAETVAGVVQEIDAAFSDADYEVVLINDGSTDSSETACCTLADRAQGRVVYLHLTRNFGEHNAVMAGLNHARGQYVAVLDDDGQNPPAEARRMLDHAIMHKLDVVYGGCHRKQHSWFRNFGSLLNDRMANVMLGKPRELYLSSFKVVSHFMVDQITRYRGPFPYIDGLIYRTTRNIGQIEVEHRAREKGRSGYTLLKLIALWLNMFLGFSIMPLRIATLLGLAASSISALLLVGIVIDKLWIAPELTHGIPTILALTVFFAGVQLVVLGTVGEYVGRVFLEQNGRPQFVVRYEIRNERRRAPDA